MPMVWSVGGCSSLGPAQAVPWLPKEPQAAIFRDCVLSATLVIRFSQKSLSGSPTNSVTVVPETEAPRLNAGPDGPVLDGSHRPDTWGDEPHPQFGLDGRPTAAWRAVFGAVQGEPPLTPLRRPTRRLQRPPAPPNALDARPGLVASAAPCSRSLGVHSTPSPTVRAYTLLQLARTSSLVNAALAQAGVLFVDTASLRAARSRHF